MSKTVEMTASQLRQMEVFETGLITADCYVSRNYLIDLSQNSVVPLQEDLLRDTTLRFYKIEKFV